jgi:hypothetical protein
MFVNFQQTKVFMMFAFLQTMIGGKANRSTLQTTIDGKIHRSFPQRATNPKAPLSFASESRSLLQKTTNANPSATFKVAPFSLSLSL